MYKYNINITDEPDKNGFQPFMTAYILESDCNDSGLRPAVMICPGGGYECVCENWEGERYAMAYAAAGFDAVTVNYTTKGGGTYPCQIKQLARAIEITREHAAEWEIDPNKIAVCGSSAGGHLAASISTLWNCEEIFTKEEITSRRMRPDATILCYPVITGGEKAHKGSFIALTGTENENDPLWEFLSLEKQVDADTPPAFLWHCFDDDLVPVENSIYYAEALRKYDIPFEMHIYPSGGHGIQLTTERILRCRSVFKRNYNWHGMSVDWLADVFNM